MQTRKNVQRATLLAISLLIAAASAFGQTPQKCDVNGDGLINQTDINLIVAALNRPATGPSDPRDADNNGIINALDARTCTTRCTLASCALGPGNTAPVATNDSYSTPEDTTLVVAAPGVLGNDTDAQNNPLTAAVVTGPVSGTLVLSGNGSFSYMPPVNFSGPVTFTYRANDGALNSNIATVTINVTAVDDGPTALPDTYSTAEDTPLSVAAPGVLANDGDVDGPTLIAQLVAGPPASAGTVTLNGDGSFLFTPAANFTGAATFTYVASDGLLQSSVTTVTVNVAPINDVPVANADSYSTDEDVTLVVAAPGVLGNDSDVEGSSLSAILGTPPATGTLVLSPNGSFTYTPAPNFSGTASFTYRASDGVATSSPATVSLTVLSINDLPVAANDSYSTLINAPLSVAAPGVLANDTDQEGSGLTAVLGAGPANGTLVLNANGSFTYTPNAGFTGTDTFTYRANDGTANSNLATATIVVNPVIVPPTANSDSYSTPEDTQLSVAAPGVLGNDTNVGSLTASLVAGPATGSLTLNPNGGFTFTPSANFNGPVTFSYRLTDGVSNSNTATVTISVTPVNDAPVAGNDSYSTPEDTQLIVTGPGVLANDIDLEGTPLVASLVAGPAHGVLTLSSNGGFLYTPDANFNGSDSFTYRASDGALLSNIATVNLTITPVNDPPVAGNDSYSTTAGVTLTVAAPGVLGNDADVEGSTLTAVLVASPATGTLNLASDGSFTYAPAAGFTGPVTFTYRASDGVAQSNLATVTVTVTSAPNTPPVAVNDGYSTPEDTALVIAAPGILGNDTDVDGNPLTAIQVTGPAQGNLTLNANGSFTYTPPPQFNGPVTFTYRANDGIVDSSNVATVTINVTPVNDAPVGNPDTYSTPEDTQLVVAAQGVLGNDTDPEGDTLTAGLVSGPASGSLTLLSTGAFQYTPALNFNGQVSFMYRANDGLANSNVTTVTINVTPINDVPVANGDSYTTDEDTTLTVAAPGVLGNDTDVEGTGLTAILVTPPATGTLTLNPNGSFTYVPQANLSGSQVTFTYRVSDGLLQSTPATVTITVLPINDAPVAQVDSYSTPIGTTLNVVAPGVLANDTDQEGSGLTAVLDVGPTKGSLTLNPNGSFSYTPNAGASGSDTFTYHAFDGFQGSNLAIVTISLTGGTMTLTVQDPFIAIGGSTQGTITLSTPAPAGGTSVQLTSSTTSAATVLPATVLIAQNQTTGTFAVNGVGIGSTTINATAPGYDNGSVGVTVTASVITVGNVTVAPGGQAQFPVTLSTPAPAGGLTVTLTSLDTGIATVPASVVIPAGQSVANPNPMVTGVAPGATTIRGTAPSYAPGAGTATVAIAASFSPNPVVVVEGGTAQTTLTLAQPAPAGGITVNLVTAIPARATVASPVTIAAGQTSAQVTVTGVQQGSTLLTATGVGLVTTTATVNVTPPPAITLPDQSVGKDLQVQVTFSLGAPAPAGNLLVTISSSNPAKMVVASNATTAGAASIPITITAGQSSGTFYVQALDSTGVVAAQVTAPGYANGQANITLAPSGLHILSAADFSTGVGSPDTPLRVCAARLSGTTIQTSQQVRGGATVNVAVTSSNTAVGTIVNSPFALTGGNSCTPNSGALAFHPLAFGTSTLTVTQPAGFTTPSTQQSMVATVGAPITINGTSTIGKDLQRQVTFLLGSPAPAGNLVVTLTSSDPSKLLLSNNGSTAGSSVTTVTVPAGQTSGTFFAQSLVNSGAADVTGTAPGYSSGSTNIPFGPSGFRFNESNFSIGVGDPNQFLSVCPVLLNASNVWQANLALRGGITVDLVITSSNTTVGSIVGSPFAFVGGNGCQNTAAFDPSTNGTSTISLATPAGFNTPTTSQSIVATVQANITGSNTTVGKNLQVGTTAFLGSPAPAGNLVVTITSADPARLLVAPNATTAGAASINLVVGAGGSSTTYTVQALDSTGTVDVSLSAPGYTSGTATHSLVPSGFYINSPGGTFTTNTLDPNTAVQLCAARLNPATLTVVASGTLRFGIAAVPVSVTSSNTAVGTIVNASQLMAGNTSCTVGGAPGIQFDPVGVGTSTIAMGPTPSGFSTPSNTQSSVATVTASGIIVNATTVGKNLQVGASGSLQSPAPAGGVAVTLTSADPTKLLLAPNTTTAGTASIVVNVATGGTSFSYTLQALDDTGTVQVTASATGLSSGAGTVTLVPSGFYINSPGGTFTTNTLDPNTAVQLCAARLNPTTLTIVTNGTLRFGIAAVPVSVTSSNTAVGTIVNPSQMMAGNTSCTVGGAPGIQFDPVGVGTSTIAMGPTPSGFSTPSNTQSSVATVTASGINVNSTTVGKNLQVGSSGSLQSPAPAGGVAVTLTSADPTKLLLAPNATTAGTASIVVNVAAGGTSFSYTVQALDEAGTVQVTATASGFTSGAGTITLAPSGFVINNGNFATTTLDPNTNLQVCAARLNPVTLNLVTNGTLRFGIAPVSVSMTSSNTAVGTIVNTPQTIAGNASCTVNGASGLQFDPIGAGSSTLAMGPTPAGFSTPSNSVSITATVTASGINLSSTTLGKDMQVTVSGSLQAPAPAGGVTVTLTSADPAKLLVSPGLTIAGGTTTMVNVAANATSFTYVVQALDGSVPVQVTASAPGFVSGATNMTLVPSGFVIDTPGSITTTAAAANINIRICAARLNPTTLNLVTNATLRFGIAAVSVGMTSSNAAAGVIVNSPQSIAGNTSCTVFSAAGFQFDPVAPGTSTLSLGATPSGFSTPSNFQAINATVN